MDTTAPVPQVDIAPIPMHAVESSKISAIGYRPESQTLAVRFRHSDGSPGALYHYANFTAENWAEFEEAESLGSYFIKNIQKAKDKYPYQRINETPAEPEAAAA